VWDKDEFNAIALFEKKGSQADKTLDRRRRNTFPNQLEQIVYFIHILKFVSSPHLSYKKEMGKTLLPHVTQDGPYSIF